MLQALLRLFTVSVVVGEAILGLGRAVQLQLLLLALELVEVLLLGHPGLLSQARVVSAVGAEPDDFHYVLFGVHNAYFASLFLELVEELLGVTPDLAARPGLDDLLHLRPLLPVDLESCIKI